VFFFNTFGDSIFFFFLSSMSILIGRQTEILINEFASFFFFLLLDVFTLSATDDMWTASIKNDAHIDNDMISSRDQT
jgi:hypothetical protein